MAPAARPRRLRHGPRRGTGGVKRRRGTRRRDQQEAPAPTATQVRTIQGIVNLFETGSILGDYGQVTIIPGDTGHLTFGRSQTTLGSGGLYLLLRRYCGNAGARFGSRLAAYLDRIAAPDVSLDRNLPLHNILRATADDPVMRDTQDSSLTPSSSNQRCVRRAALASPTLWAAPSSTIRSSTVPGSGFAIA